MPESLWPAVQQETDKQQNEPPARSHADRGESSATGQTGARPKDETRHRPEDGMSIPNPERPPERRTRRRPYDFYTDQILWLKEMKLEIEKTYSQSVTANAMVQLAVDLLIEDYERNKERSKLISELVSNQTS